MSEQDFQNDSGAQAPAAPQLSEAERELVRSQLRAQQNFIGGLIGGTLAAGAGAGIWAAITLATGFQIGWMAVGVGFLVGMAVRVAGKGIDPAYGVMGAVLALAGCAGGNLLTVVGWISGEQGIPFMTALASLELAAVPDLMVATFSPMDLLFYGIAVYEGFKLSVNDPDGSGA